MSEQSQVALVKKSLPWLKRLQGDLDDDDSSDSCSLPADVTPKKTLRAKPDKKEPKTGRIKKKRPHQLKSESSDDASSEGSGDKKEKKRRLVKKPVKGRRNQSKSEESKVESSIATDSTKFLKGKRVGKLRASRATNDPNERISAIKLKGQQPARGLKATRDRMRERRAAQKASAAVDADVEDEGEPRRQRKVRPAATKETTAKATKSKRKVITSTKPDSKTEPVDSPTHAIGKVSDSVPDGKSVVEPAAVTKDVAVDLEKNEDDKTKVISPARADDKEESSVARNSPSKTVTAECDTKPSVVTNEPSSNLEASNTSVKIDDSEEVIKECTVRDSPEHTEASNGMSTIDNAETSKSEPVEPVMADPSPVLEATTELMKIEADGEGQPNAEKTESIRKTELLDTMPIPRKSPIKGELAAPSPRSEMTEAEEGQANFPTPKNEDAKKPTEEELLDNMPIPRKTKEEGSSAPSPCAPSFVIPKRTFPKTDAGFKATEHAGRAVPRPSPSKRSLNPPVAVRVPPQPPPQSSPTAEFIPPQRKRTKNPVPVKNAPFSPQDRALMRLSRKRNSIFMAAAELAAHSTDTMGSKKGPTTRMLGYEVYDVEGKTLSDLISRLTCATKREMASDRESFTTSFFGVSCLAPKAKGECSNSVVDECGANEPGAQKINCYEELCFERPEDREFYQRKMYGTAFVPQNVRGRITLIVRNARFERKSTGIRFNQDRDREEFAATLSKRYTFKKSVPRCDIPRENWLRLMRNQPGTVYLHYYNREDAERASQVFRDDDGQLLQIRLELKAGAKIKKRYSSASESRPEHTPRRSCSSERGAPEPSPLSSQHGSARNTPSWRRDRSSASYSDRNPRYDRGAPPPPLAPWPRGEDRYGPSVSGNKRLRAMLERRSRSRSRPKSFQRQRSDSYDRAGSETGGQGSIQPSGAGKLARIDGGNVNDGNNDTTGSPAQKRARTVPLSPRRSPISDQDRRVSEKKFEGGPEVHDTGEVKSTAEVSFSSPVGNSDGGDSRREMQRGRSPPRRWQQEPHNASPHPRRGSFSDNSRNRPTESTQYRSSQQQPPRNSSTQRPRSRSRPRTSSPGRRGRGGNNGDRYQERRGSRDYGRGDSYGNNGRMHDRGRGGYLNNNRGGGEKSRPSK